MTHTRQAKASLVFLLLLFQPNDAARSEEFYTEELRERLEYQGVNATVSGAETFGVFQVIRPTDQFVYDAKLPYVAFGNRFKNFMMYIGCNTPGAEVHVTLQHGTKHGGFGNSWGRWRWETVEINVKSGHATLSATRNGPLVQIDGTGSVATAVAYAESDDNGNWTGKMGISSPQPPRGSGVPFVLKILKGGRHIQQFRFTDYGIER